MNFSAMNETDVRELIVRPLIQRLGYEIGTSNNVRSEFKLTYHQRILGHRKPRTDHKMTGFADYICEVISYGRWTTEVKAPNVELSQRDWEQAFSYASHPEIAAAHFLLTNGKLFRVYSMLEPTSPILEWTFDQQNEMWVNIENVLGPKQIHSRFEREQRHRGKALAPGLGSSAVIVGGRLDYADYEASDPAQAAALQHLKGLRATVESGHARRDESGLICAHLKIAGPTAQWDELNRLAGVDGYDFLTTDEHISTDEERPTILQGLTRLSVPAGASIGGLPGVPANVDRLPFGMEVSAFTQAVGFLSEHTMRGVFSIEYLLKLPPAIQASLPKPAPFTSNGDFYINLG